MYWDDLPIQTEGLMSGIPSITAAHYVREAAGELDESEKEFRLIENRPLLVTDEWYSDYSLVGMYIVKKSMTQKEYLRILTEALGGSYDSEKDEVSNVSTMQFLKYAIENGYLMGPIQFSEINDYWGLSIR